MSLLDEIPLPYCLRIKITFLSNNYTTSVANSKNKFNKLSEKKLLLQAQILDDLVVFLLVGLFEVFEVASAVGNHLKKASARVLILKVLA